METLYIILVIVHSFLAFFLVFPFFTVILSLLVREKVPAKTSKEADFACVITGFKNAAIAIPLIDSFLKQNYKNHHIYFVADDCDLSTVTIPHSSQLTVLRPVNKLGSKVKSFIHAKENFVRQHEAILVLDPDNLGDPEFLNEINRYFQAGYKAVQGKRIAKNLDTVYACLDATGELYFNYTQRLVPHKLGCSATIAGSGMAIDYDLFSEYLDNPHIVQNLDKVIVSEDKILQNVVIDKGVVIAFSKNALLYDEKVSKGDQVQRQRTRWMKTYFDNTRDAGKLVLRGIGTFSMNRLLFGLMTVSPPMFLLVVSSFFLFVIDLILFPYLSLSVVTSGFIFVVNFIWVLKLADAPKEIWKNLYAIPAFVSHQILALLKMKKAKDDFLTTTHTNVVTLESLKDKNKESVK